MSDVGNLEDFINSSPVPSVCSSFRSSVSIFIIYEEKRDDPGYGWCCNWVFNSLNNFEVAVVGLVNVFSPKNVKINVN